MENEEEIIALLSLLIGLVIGLYIILFFNRIQNISLEEIDWKTVLETYWNSIYPSLIMMGLSMLFMILFKVKRKENKEYEPNR